MELSKKRYALKIAAATAEVLEIRRMFVPAVGLYGDSVIIYAGGSADNIVISKSGTNLKIVYNATNYSFPYASVKKIFANLFAGDDKFTSDNSVTQPMNVDGNFGKDTITTGGGDDSIFSGNEDDKIFGGNGRDTIDGGSGNDSINGDGGNDSLFDGSGADKVYGGSGDDFLDAGLVAVSSDLYDGGEGLDYINYKTRTGGVCVTTDGVANDGKRIGTGTSTTEFDNVLPSIEKIIGSPKSDFISLKGNIKNYVDGREGNDFIEAGPGNDSILGYYGDDIIHGQEGNDSLYGEIGIDLIFGDSGNDSIEGGSDNDELHGGDNDDTISGGSGKDLLLGEGGNDVLNGNADNDNLLGGKGNDVLQGSAGYDSMYGESGNDIIYSFDNVYYEIVDGGIGYDIAQIDKLGFGGTPADALTGIESWY